MANIELGSLNWWRDRRYGGQGIRKAGRRLARTMHSAYHVGIADEQKGVLWQWQGRDGLLRQTMISHLEMQRAIQGAIAWCQNNFGDNLYARAHAGIAQRLPPKWAKDPIRGALAARAFRELCEGRVRHDWGDKMRLAAQVNLSADTIDNYRLDFFLIAAALALDDDAWAEAMTGKRRWVDKQGRQHEEKATEPEELAHGH